MHIWRSRLGRAPLMKSWRWSLIVPTLLGLLVGIVLTQLFPRIM